MEKEKAIVKATHQPLVLVLVLYGKYKTNSKWTNTIHATDSKI